MPQFGDSTATIVDALRSTAAAEPDARALTFLPDGETEKETLTYAQLHRGATAFAERLRERLARGSRAVLVYPSGVEYVTALFGCFYAGIVAVPAYLPRQRNRDRLTSILTDCTAEVVLTTAETRGEAESALAPGATAPPATWVSTDDWLQEPASHPESAEPPHPEELAFLQYTSGSTSTPKGVMVSHANLVDNIRLLGQLYSLPEGARIVSWLPLYHDMGLILKLLMPLYTRREVVLMPPAAFIQRPIRWLRAIDRYQADLSAAPPFAFQLCVHRITDEQKQDLDLSHWRIAPIAAEPVRSSVLQAFHASFASCGFRPNVLLPCYGLAEATLAASSVQPGSLPVVRSFDASDLREHRVTQVAPDDAAGQTLVSCGTAFPGHRIDIVDPDTLRACENGRVGEIWVSGPSIAGGYWNAPEVSEATFRARIAGDTAVDAPTFLRTGDLGFFHEEELYIGTRIKDLIILAGRNHYPQDFEQTVEQCHPAIHLNGAVAFSIDVEDVERLVVIAEIARPHLEGLDAVAVTAAVHEALAERHEVEAHAVELVVPGSVPRTSSGKVQRRAARTLFLAGAFERAGGPAPVAPAQPAVPVSPALAPASREPAAPPRVDFSLFYFSSNDAEFQRDKYQLVVEGARFADARGFTAVWVPERHFHAFGGIYPNAGTLAAALAMVTRRVRLRAGSVVLPLHDPIRVAEEWSVVDNLSSGRVDLAFARGWNPNDFVLAPDRFADSAGALWRGMETVRTLWRGGSVPHRNGKGETVDIRIFPLPMQRELATWITCSGSPERFVEAGEAGHNVLTALLFQTPEELGGKIAAYREARARKGFDPAAGQVTVMLHAYVGTDRAEVLRAVRGPFMEYLKNSVDLWRQENRSLDELTPRERDRALEYAFERYTQTSALFGTPESCMAQVQALGAMGATEIACLIDFGLPTDVVLEGLRHLDRLRAAANGEAAAPGAGPADVSLAGRVESRPAAQRPGTGAAERVRAIRDAIVREIAAATGAPEAGVALDRSFLSLGINSVRALQIVGALEDELSLELSPALLFEFPTVTQLAAALAERGEKRAVALPASAGRADDVRDEDIAIIGMGCRFPQAPTLEAYWKLLREGRDAVTEVPADHWDWRLVFASDPEAEGKTYSRWGGFLDGVADFDAAFFGISPREARVIDPQQRIYLEVAWEALENAGYAPDSLSGQPVGVFVGSSSNGYYPRIKHLLTGADHAAGAGNLNAVIPNRVSYALNLRGPSVLVDTACSASMVALHQACRSLRAGECTMALAGGVNLLLSPDYYVGMSRMRTHSPDGRCKTFDHRADGIVLGEGAGALLLKPLRRALEDGDHVWAVVKGSAVNHGGRANGLTAPNPRAQIEVIRAALRDARASADSISYVEAHGTGTALGDPIEVEGLVRSFRADTDRVGYCTLGSVKTNIGHLEAAAGVAGVIKVVLAMHHRELPPTLHFERANPVAPLDGSPFRVGTALAPWVSAGTRRAGVSSFGIGGTNGHVILEEPPVLPARAEGGARGLHLLPLAARSEAALRALAGRYAEALGATRPADFADFCYTAGVGRSGLPHRAALVVRTREEARRALAAVAEGSLPPGVVTGRAPEGPPPGVAFLFTGQGSHFAGMGRRLHDTEPPFREVIERCDEAALPYLGRPLADFLAGDGPAGALLGETRYAQPVLYALGCALAELWRSWGVQPAVLLGHSLGEYVAAQVAGVFSLEDGLRFVAERGRLMQEVREPGRMVAVSADEATVRAALARVGGRLDLAALNAASHVVVSGEEEAVGELVRALERDEVPTRPLPTSRAFHSSLMDGVLDSVEAVARGVPSRAPELPLVSNLTGELVPDGDVPDAAYWRRHLREPVRFADGVRTALRQGCTVFLEVGAGSTLLNLARRVAPGAGALVPSLQRGTDDQASMLGGLARLYTAGAPVDWAGLERGRGRRRIVLPTYPFERRRYWLDGEPPVPAAAPVTAPGVPSGDGAVPERAAAAPPHAARSEEVLTFLRRETARLLEIPESEIHTERSFLEQGADSLVLVEALRRVHAVYGVTVTIREIFEKCSTLDALAAHIVASAPAPAVPQAAPAPVLREEPRASGALSGPQPLPALRAAGSDVLFERVVAQQLAAMSDLAARQLTALLGTGERHAPAEPAVPAGAAAAAGPAREVSPAGGAEAPPAAASAGSVPEVGAPTPWTPYSPLDPGSPDDLTGRQRAYLGRFVAEYAARTRRSKEETQRFRGVHADLRASMSFRLCTKEIRYPIVGARSRGSRLWDVDGNEYADYTMGYGVTLFGHNPPFVQAALEEQLARGIHIGPQTELAGAAAALLCEVTGMERATFANSGTEAVMAALRIARATTGRARIAIFAGAYHGTHDSVLAAGRTAGGEPAAAPLVPGLPAAMVADIVVLRYGSQAALDYVRRHGHELAGVLVEAVQSRRPDLQPREFLHELRRLTAESGAALIFDEVITGLRLGARGAQGYFGVDADLATYGKVVGGGLPIGVVAGRSRFMDAVDGGAWKYGDDSVPGALTTLYTGTFCKHPLAMAAAVAVLEEIRRRGEALYQGLDAATADVVGRLNASLSGAGVPVEVVRCGSLFRLAGPLQLMPGDALDLLFYHLIHKGVYVWEGRNWFLSTEHEPGQLDRLVAVMDESLAEMRDGGFLPETNAAAGGRAAHGPPREETAPATERQRQIWQLSHLDADGSLACTQTAALRLRGPLDEGALSGALAELASRHEALRTTLSADGRTQRILRAVEVPLARMGPAADEAALGAALEAEASRPFDLAAAPLWRASLLPRDADEHVLVVSVHDLVADGWSFGIILWELSALYSGRVDGRVRPLPEPVSFREFAGWLAEQLRTPEAERAGAYWRDRFSRAPDTSLAGPRRGVPSPHGRRLHARLDAALARELESLAARTGGTLFMVLAAAYQVLLAQVTGQAAVTATVASAGQTLGERSSVVGPCMNLVPLSLHMDEETTFAGCVAAVRSALLEADDHRLYAFADALAEAGAAGDPGRWPFFNLDRLPPGMEFAGLEAGFQDVPISHAAFDFALNVTQVGRTLHLAMDFRTELLDAGTVEAWMHAYLDLLARVAREPGVRIASLPAAPARPVPELDGTAGAPAPDRAPREGTERIVADICAGVLGLPAVSATAGFFALGGQSLLATQVLSRIRDAFGVSLGLRELFAEPSVEAIARRVDRARAAGDAAALPPITAGARGEPAPCSFAQRRLWLIDQIAPGNTAYNMVGALRVGGPLDMDALRRALAEVVRRHEVLRTRFERAGAEPVQVVDPPGDVPLELVDWSGEGADDSRVTALAQERASVPFDLKRGPLLRAAVVRLEAEEHAIVLVVHHIVSDGWSMGVLAEELVALCDAFTRGAPSPLPEPALQYADFARWQRASLTPEAIRPQLDYWLEQLRGAPTTLPLPTDRPRAGAPSFRGAHEPFELDSALAGRVAAFSARHGATPFMTLLAAFGLLLGRYAGRDDLVIGTDIAGRTRTELEPLIGFFVNLLPLRLRPAGELTVGEYMRRVRDTTLDAYANQDLPFDRLVSALRLGRKGTNTPLVQVLCVLHNVRPPDLGMDGARVEPRLIPMETAEFELILSIESTEGGIRGTVGYSTDLFERASTLEMLRRFGVLLEAFVAEDGRALSALALLPEDASGAASSKRVEVLRITRDPAGNGSPATSPCGDTGATGAAGPCGRDCGSCSAAVFPPATVDAQSSRPTQSQPPADG